MRDTILYDSALRLFGDHVSPRLLAAAEAGTWPPALWREVDEAGYLDVLADGTGGMVEAVAILRAAGHHAAPIPLPETMLARWLCAATGIDAPAGPLSIALVEPDGPAIAPVPWGARRRGGRACLRAVAAPRPPRPARFECGISLAGEPRDVLTGIERGSAGRRCRMRSRPTGARRRGAAAGGADGRGDGSRARPCDHLCERPGAVRPPDRQVPGDPAAACAARRRGGGSLVAVESAAVSVAEGRPSAEFAIAAAKIRAGEAAGAVAEIAHQVHGAIGFTEEHSLHCLTRRLWSWRDEFGDETYWAGVLGRRIAAAGGAGLWPLITTT